MRTKDRRSRHESESTRAKLASRLLEPPAVVSLIIVMAVTLIWAIWMFSMIFEN